MEVARWPPLVLVRPGRTRYPFAHSVKPPVNSSITPGAGSAEAVPGAVGQLARRQVLTVQYPGRTLGAGFTSTSPLDLGSGAAVPNLGGVVRRSRFERAEHAGEHGTRSARAKARTTLTGSFPASVPWLRAPPPVLVEKTRKPVYCHPPESCFSFACPPPPGRPRWCCCWPAAASPGPSRRVLSRVPPRYYAYCD